ncbi:MAG TPA: FecR family protein, partial [Oligoflexia bacterium]|nr:FecR family protein [Oligoflexia bacterium]
MGRSFLTLNILLFIISSSSLANSGRKPASESPSAKAPFTGVVVLTDGTVYSQRGSVHYTRPNLGRKIKVNDFGQYQDAPAMPVFVKFATDSQRYLKPNGLVFPGDVLLTAGEGFTKILFRDNSLVDMGPGAALEIAKFDVDQDLSKKRDVELRIAYGKFRVIVADPLRDGQTFKVYTPNTMMNVRGTEFIVNVFTDKEGLSQTDVVCLHGQVSVDLAKPTTKGLVYHQTAVVNPGVRFRTEGHNGLTREVMSKALNPAQLREAVKSTSPLVNALATYAAVLPRALDVPGTGVSNIAQARRYPDFKALANKPTGEELLQPSRRIASLKNFDTPEKDFDVS